VGEGKEEESVEKKELKDQKRRWRGRTENNPVVRLETLTPFMKLWNLQLKLGFGRTCQLEF
jgi:hypothetical protein